MSNSSYGTMKVVAKNKDVLKRIKDIMNYDDDEYCLYRCNGCEEQMKPFEECGYWVQEFEIDGAWSCEPFLNYGDHPEIHLKDYAKNEDGSIDYNNKVEGTAHFTDLAHLAKKLDFGAMFWTCEPGCGFAERGLVNHNGYVEYDKESYEELYPDDEDGEENREEEPEIESGFGDEFGDFINNEEIYG